MGAGSVPVVKKALGGFIDFDCKHYKSFKHDLRSTRYHRLDCNHDVLGYVLLCLAAYGYF
jgi:hypothetical protein